MHLRKRRINYKQFGEVLLDLRMISDNQLKQALKIQKEQKSNTLLGNILIEMGAINDEDVANVFTMQYSFPFLHVDSLTIDAELIHLIPHQLVRRHCLIPVSKMGRCVSIAMANPLDVEAIKAVESSCQCKVHVLVATSSGLTRVIGKYYPAQSPEDEERDYASELDKVLAEIEAHESSTRHNPAIQRRYHERFAIQDQVFLALENESRKPFKLYDISVNGVSGLLDHQLPVGEIVDIDFLSQPVVADSVKKRVENELAEEFGADNAQRTATLLNGLFERSPKKQARVAWCHQTGDNMWRVGLDLSSDYPSES